MLLKKADSPIYASIIAKEIDSTYAHTLSVLSKLAEIELVNFEEVGRIKLVRLTEIGAGVADVLETFNDMMDLASIKRKIERIYQKEVQGRPPVKINWKNVSKRLTRYKEELERFMAKEPKLKEHAEGTAKRIDQILAEGKR